MGQGERVGRREPLSLFFVVFEKNCLNDRLAPVFGVNNPHLRSSSIPTAWEVEHFFKQRVGFECLHYSRLSILIWQKAKSNHLGHSNEPPIQVQKPFLKFFFSLIVFLPNIIPFQWRIQIFLLPKWVCWPIILPKKCHKLHENEKNLDPGRGGGDPLMLFRARWKLTSWLAVDLRLAVRGAIIGWTANFLLKCLKSCRILGP